MTTEEIIPENFKLIDFTQSPVKYFDQGIAFCIERADGQKLDVWCDREQLKNFIAFACGVLQTTVEGLSHAQKAVEPSEYYLVPVPVLGVGFNSSVPSQTAFVLTLPGLALGFEIDISGLQAIAIQFAQVAATLAAGEPRKQ
jgi:hypothetical protein